MGKCKTLADCINLRDLSTAKQLIQEGQDPFLKDNQGFSPYARAKNLGLTDFCFLFNQANDTDGTPQDELSSHYSTQNQSKKKQNKDLPYFKIIAVGIVVLIIVIPKIVGPGQCDNAGWTGKINESTWSHALYEQCHQNVKNGVDIKKKVKRVSTYSSSKTVTDKTYSQPQSVNENSRDKQIFLELVRLQDAGLSKEQSESQIMKKYGIKYSALLSILTKGAQEGWLN